MKAVITREGVLVVVAETETEAYALGKWAENYEGGEASLTLSYNKGHIASFEMIKEDPNDETEDDKKGKDKTDAREEKPG